MEEFVENGVLFVIECGIKRKAEKHVCKNCGKDFARVIHRKRKVECCSQKCSSIFSRNRVVLRCCPEPSYWNGIDLEWYRDRGADSPEDLSGNSGD